jgi:hypothetical protein
MPAKQHEVSTAAELLHAASDTDVANIVVSAELDDLPTFRLSAGQRLTGSGRAVLRFANGQDGVQLSTGNRVEDLELCADIERRALYNDATVTDLGRLELRKLRITGVVQLLARDRVRSGHVSAEDIHIVAADSSGYTERPKGYGVEVVPGAFTLWNQQPDNATVITTDLVNLTAGRAGKPVCGSGIFVSGAGDEGGRIVASRLETGAVYSDGRIAAGTPDRISGGVFVVHGAFVDCVRNRGPVTTCGPNDMVLDNWGTVDRWIADGKITSYGPSGIGFVNFGIVEQLEVNGAIETFGQGARGFNVYTGTVNNALFDRIVTHGDGAVGIQIARPVGRIAVRRGIQTYGGTGDSLVKGVVIKLSAIAFSVKPGGSAREVEIAGGLVTHGHGVMPLELQGAIEALRITEGCAATAGFEQTAGGR